MISSIDVPEKASEPKEGGVTGRHVRSVREEQFVNALEPILVTLSGIVMFVRLLQL